MKSKWIVYCSPKVAQSRIGFSQTFNWWILAWLFAYEKRKDNFVTRLEIRSYEYDD